MRLWHQELIPKLPRQQLLGQWRECIALLGNGWGKKHSTVDYVFKYDERKLISYTKLIMFEMLKRKYKPNKGLVFKALQKRMKFSKASTLVMASDNDDYTRWIVKVKKNIYPEHNKEYLQECLDNLKNKGIFL